MNYKKGAMFGLDARIALAIFGALSVISGAALYSAIQSANAEKWRQYLIESVKSHEQYYFDNGKHVPLLNSNSVGAIYASDLTKNRESLSTWKGPYLEYSYNLNDQNFRDYMTNFSTTANQSAYLQKSSDWTGNDNLMDEVCVVGDSNCSLWIAIYAGSASYADYVKDIFLKLDLLVDNGDGELKGNIRFNNLYHGRLMYKGFPRKKTS